MSKENRKRMVARLPLLPLRGLSVLPNTIVTIDIARDRSLAAVRSAAQGEDQRLFAVAQRDLKKFRSVGMPYLKLRNF